jgi:hypothetical protein
MAASRLPLLLVSQAIITTAAARVTNQKRNHRRYSSFQLPVKHAGDDFGGHSAQSFALSLTFHISVM